ncbi:hypothetical protein PVAP13_6KG385166 [Panicum virgatum]|uniref:Uncharacterized protein n=1 Tax=Panicum virgatum TaxID=38727 RepID=A0A8T0RKV2_PANVG|nr:hypothetical protein PVAP13_6KG385166 [Panicum virgatum]
MGAQTRGRAGAARPAPRHGRPAGGLEQRSSQAASRARGSPAACYLPLPSPALTVNASRGRFPVRGACLGRRALDFPRLLLFARGSGPVLLAPLPHDSLGVCPTPIYAYTTPNSVRRTPYMLKSSM